MTAVRHPMGAMFANRPSPRPGFTYVTHEHATRQGPVVAVVSDSSTSVTALERAAGEATRRSLPLHVLDTYSSGELKERLTTVPGNLDSERVATALSILTRPDVAVQVVDGSSPHGLVEYCASVKASTLVVDLECLEQLLTHDRLLGSLIHEINRVCDLLILIEGAEDRS